MPPPNTVLSVSRPIMCGSNLSHLVTYHIVPPLLGCIAAGYCRYAAVRRAARVPKPGALFGSGCGNSTGSGGRMAIGYNGRCCLQGLSDRLLLWHRPAILPGRLERGRIQLGAHSSTVAG